MDGPKEVVELTIDQKWWLWRGYWPNSRDGTWIKSPELALPFGNLLDPMDSHNYSEEHAFPLHKPSIDVFGIPTRSRKQRGWYQVHDPSRASVPSISVFVETVPQPLRTAGDLPSELVSMMVQACVSMDPQAHEADPEYRHTLASAAQVCRHWASVLQSSLFSPIAVRSHCDMTQLLGMRRTSSRIAQYGMTLRLEQTLDSRPFTHLAHRLQAGETGSYYIITGPLPTSKGTTLRSIHGCIPRSLPRACRLGFRELMLQDIHFRSFMDLAHLVWELPSLYAMQGTRLTWSSEPKWSEKAEMLQPFNIRPRWQRRLSRIELTDCKPRHYWLASQLKGYPLVADTLAWLIHKVDEQLQSLNVHTCTVICRRELFCEQGNYARRTV